MNSINWPAPTVWVSIAQLGGQCSTNAEAMGSNTTEALKICFGFNSQLLKLQLQLQWSHLRFIYFSDPFKIVPSAPITY